MDCVIKYKGQSIPEEQFLQYLNKQIAINNLFNENENLANAVYEALRLINTSEILGLGIMAADYLLTGGIDSIISSDYFAHALMGIFTKDANNILNIWNKYKNNVNNKYGNLADFIKTNEYNNFIQEVKQRISESMKEISKSREHSTKVGLKHKGKVISEEQKNKISQANKGRIATSKLTWDIVNNIRELSKQGYKDKQIAEMFNITKAQACNIKNFKS